MVRAIDLTATNVQRKNCVLMLEKKLLRVPTKIFTGVLMYVSTIKWYEKDQSTKYV